jgi:putative membrane protein
MNRRSISLALAGASLLPVSAMAQGATGGGAMNRSPGPGAAPQANTPPANMTSMAPDQLVKMTHEAGGFSLATARVGMEKASNPDVKRFANFEVREQEGMAQAMKMAGHNLPDPQFGGEKYQTLQRLQAANGAEFDRMFLQVQEQGHQELLNLTTAMAGSQAPMPDKLMALLASDRIREHMIDISVLQGRG